MNTREEIELNPDTNPYKESLLNAFRKIEDPFGIEILGQTGGANFTDTSQTSGFFDYEQNPAEPTKPQKKVEISQFVGKNWE